MYIVIYTELGKLLYESNILHITSYFYEEVMRILQLDIYQKLTLLYYY